MKIKEFQKRIKDNFYHKDSIRGAEKTFIWLVEEIGELGTSVMKNDVENISEELSDVIAWTVSLANIYDMDLEKILSEKYPPNCSYCSHTPCICEKKIET